MLRAGAETLFGRWLMRRKRLGDRAGRNYTRAALVTMSHAMPSPCGYGRARNGSAPPEHTTGANGFRWYCPCWRSSVGRGLSDRGTTQLFGGGIRRGWWSAGLSWSRKIRCKSFAQRAVWTPSCIFFRAS